MRQALPVEGAKLAVRLDPIDIADIREKAMSKQQKIIAIVAAAVIGIIIIVALVGGGGGDSSSPSVTSERGTPRMRNCLARELGHTTLAELVREHGQRRADQIACAAMLTCGYDRC